MFAEAQLSSGAQAEEYWPDLEGLDFRDTVTEFELPEGTFLEGILRTAAQNNNANVGVSAEVAKGGTICRRDRISVS